MTDGTMRVRRRRQGAVTKALRNRMARLLAGVCFTVSAAAWAEPTTITFLHVNDVSEYESKRGIGGVASLMTLLRRERASSANTITTFGGDLFSPSLMSALTKGAHLVEMMNAIGVDIAVAGNHEYDFGPEVAARNFAASAFPWLGTNVFDRDGRTADGLVASRIIERGGFRIGFFGLVTPETDILSSPGEGIVFASILETARNAVAALEVEGAEVIVALTHLDLFDEWELADNVRGIHLILGGHDHLPIAFKRSGTAICRRATRALPRDRGPAPGMGGAARKEVALGAPRVAPRHHRGSGAGPRRPASRRSTERRARRGVERRHRQHGGRARHPPLACPEPGDQLRQPRRRSDAPGRRGGGRSHNGGGIRAIALTRRAPSSPARTS